MCSIGSLRSTRRTPALQNFVTSGGAGLGQPGMNAHGDVLAPGLTYTSAVSVLRGQAAFSVVAVPGNVGLGIDPTRPCCRFALA
jgi:hypothetical protein